MQPSYIIKKEEAKSFCLYKVLSLSNLPKVKSVKNSWKAIKFISLK